MKLCFQRFWFKPFCQVTGAYKRSWAFIGRPLLYMQNLTMNTKLQKWDTYIKSLKFSPWGIIEFSLYAQNPSLFVGLSILVSSKNLHFHILNYFMASCKNMIIKMFTRNSSLPLTISIHTTLMVFKRFLKRCNCACNINLATSPA